jgi:preprotein translocase subunit SecD
MRHIWWTVVGIVVVTLVAAWVDLPQTHSAFGQNVTIRKGLDLAGGARILECAPNGTSDADMNTARDVINSRVAGGFGVTEPQVARVGSNCISVEIPGISSKDQNAVINNIGQTGYLALTDAGSTATLSQNERVTLTCPKEGPDCPKGLRIAKATDLNAKPYPKLLIVVPGKYVSRGSAQVGFDQAGLPTVTYTLEGKGSTDWCNYTTSHVQQYSAIVLDNRVKSDPQIRDAICGGQTQITGLQSTDEAKQISTFLNYGALPVKLHIDSSEQVAASLGPEYVREAVVAGIIGLVVVALFMLTYYRLPGLLADLALVMYSAICLAEFKLIGVTLTLAGIAGFILSIGMAVDANVLIFERMKEELRAGKTLGAAVESGFSRAFPSIRDSNASTLITTVILFWFGHNFAATVITGFATTLFLGVATSFVTAYFVSRTLLRLLVASGAARNPALYAVEEIAIPGGRVA